MHSVYKSFEVLSRSIYDAKLLMNELLYIHKSLPWSLGFISKLFGCVFNSIDSNSSNPHFVSSSRFAYVSRGKQTCWSVLWVWDIFSHKLRHCDCWKNLHSLFIYFVLSKEFRHWLIHRKRKIVKWQTTWGQNTFLLPFNKSRILRNELFWNGLSFTCFYHQNLCSYAVSKYDRLNGYSMIYLDYFSMLRKRNDFS